MFMDDSKIFFLIKYLENLKSGLDWYIVTWETALTVDLWTVVIP